MMIGIVVIIFQSASTLYLIQIAKRSIIESSLHYACNQIEFGVMNSLCIIFIMYMRVTSIVYYTSYTVPIKTVCKM